MTATDTRPADAVLDEIRGSVYGYTLDDDTFGGPFAIAHIDPECYERNGGTAGVRNGMAVLPCAYCVRGIPRINVRDNFADEIGRRETAPREDRQPGGTGITNEAALAAVLDFAASLDRKAEVADMTAVLVKGANVWLRRYTGDFEFLCDLKARARSLSPAQAKGVVNCIRAEIRRNARQSAPTQAAPLPDVPAGRYAVTPDSGSETAFYRVDRPTEGRWAGYTFVKQVIGGREDTRVPRDAQPRILAQIVEQGVKDSMLRYGREIGECGHCGRTLTNDESRALGIGPQCRARLGW